MVNPTFRGRVRYRLTFGERARIALMFIPVMLIALLAVAGMAGKPVNWRRP